MRRNIEQWWVRKYFAPGVYQGDIGLTPSSRCYTGANLCPLVNANVFVL